MPPRNPNRESLAEEHLARRIAHERTSRDWTYEGLAKRLTDVGCHIQPSAIFKIECVQPRRRITVTELVGFSQVFDLAMDELLLPPEALVDARTRTLWQNVMAAGARYQASVIEAGNAHGALAEHTAQHPEAAEKVYQLLADYEPGGTYWLPMPIDAWRATLARQAGRWDVWEAWVSEHPPPEAEVSEGAEGADSAKVTTRRKGGGRRG